MSSTVHNPRNLIIYILLLVTLSAISESILIDRICIALLFAFCLILGSKERYYLNPYFLFSITPLSLLLYINIADVYMLDLTHKTWLLAIINISAFILAIYYTPKYKSIKRCKGVGDGNRLIVTAIVLYLLSLIANVIPVLASILWLFSVPAIVCAMKTKKKIMILFSLGIIITSFFGVTSKMAVLLNLITILICFEKYYFTSLKLKRFMPILLLLSIFFMVFAFTFANKERGVYDSSEGLSYYESRGVDWNFKSGFFLPYMYLTTPWTNLQYVVETQDTRTNGLWMIKPILGYIQIDDNFITEYNLFSYSNFNTFTFIAIGFKDFGYWLSIIMSIFLGFYVKKIYTKFLISRSPFDVATYVCVALAVTEMFFSNHFFMLSYPFTILLLMEMYKSVFGKYIEIEKV
jgi:oligosaccharide repeat unit polymerase